MGQDTPSAWRCPVCGYVHRDARPPAWCSVCGLRGAAFEPHDRYLLPEIRASERVAEWRCLSCGHVHDGSTAPGECPVCSAPGGRFQPLHVESRPGTDHELSVVIVGGGIAGVSTAEAIRRCSDAADITLVSKEPELPYYRLNLTRLVAAEVGDESLRLHPRSWYDDRRVRLLTGVEMAAFVPGERVVSLRDGRRIPYDKLILTVGAHPIVPPIPGVRREGVTALRTTGDARRIIRGALDGMGCVVVGGGLLGLETAGGLAQRGARVVLLERHAWLMPRQLSRRAGAWLRRHVTDMGIDLREASRPEEIVGDDRARAVLLEDGSTVPGDLIVFATGVCPNSYLAGTAGLEVHKGVVVDSHMRSSHPDVFAAGDVAEHRGVLYGSWPAAQAQGTVAGLNALGLGLDFENTPRNHALKVLGADVTSIGTVEPEDGSCRVVEADDGPRYRRFVFRDSRLVGAVLLGDAALSPAAKRAIEARSDLSTVLGGRVSAADVADRLVSLD